MVRGPTFPTCSAPGLFDRLVAAESPELSPVAPKRILAPRSSVTWHSTRARAATAISTRCRRARTRASYSPAPDGEATPRGSTSDAVVVVVVAHRTAIASHKRHRRPRRDKARFCDTKYTTSPCALDDPRPTMRASFVSLRHKPLTRIALQHSKRNSNDRAPVARDLELAHLS